MVGQFDHWKLIIQWWKNVGSIQFFFCMVWFPNLVFIPQTRSLRCIIQWQDCKIFDLCGAHSFRMVMSAGFRPFLFLSSLKIFQPKFSPLSHFPLTFHYSIKSKHEVGLKSFLCNWVWTEVGLKSKPTDDADADDARPTFVCGTNISYVFDYDPDLYTKMVRYPLEVLAIFDIVLMNMVGRINPLFENHIQTRIFNLKSSTSVRNLNPSI